MLNTTKRCDMTELPRVELDAIGLACPMPLLKAKRALNSMETGQQLRVRATDQGSVRDFRVFAQHSGHQLLASDEIDGVYTHLLQKS
jgi:tRNA 2-thiouridine synthesizing protein A